MRRDGNRSAEKLILLRQGCGATRKLKSRVGNESDVGGPAFAKASARQAEVRCQPRNYRGRPMAAGQGPEIGEALPTLVTWRRFLSGVLPGIGEDEVTNHSLVTRVSFTRFALEKLDGFAVESQSYLLFLVEFAHELIERRKLAFSQGAQISNDLALIVCVSNRFFLHRFFCLSANSLRR